jgi:hypothetical protein
MSWDYVLSADAIIVETNRPASAAGWGFIGRRWRVSTQQPRPFLEGAPIAAALVAEPLLAVLERLRPRTNGMRVRRASMLGSRTAERQSTAWRQRR